MENKKFDNLISLANQFERASDDKYIEIIYNSNSKSITLKIREIKTCKELKVVTYKGDALADIEELENMLEMFVDKEV
jgi:hypothetical protein|nr:MAG TPA: hypothetical protein [Caudoviricetes sp.]